MRSTTLFGIYAAVILSLLGGLAGLTLYSFEKARWWDARTQLAQESYSLHQRLEANLYRLFKQNGDALLVGDRDGGSEEAELKAAIDQNLDDIRSVIAREIQMVGEEEIEELGLLDDIEADIRSVNAAIAALNATGDPIDTFVQIERLAALLDGEIDVELDRKIEAALEEEQEETQAVLDEAAAFRTWNERLVYGISLAGLAALVIGLLSFNAQIRQPIIRLQKGIDRLRAADYSAPVDLGGAANSAILGPF